MDEMIILTKIESLERCLGRINSQSPISLEILSKDFDKQDIVVLNLERAIQICVDIAAIIIAESKQPAPMTMAEGFILLAQENIIQLATCERMQKAVGFRNVAVHEYSLIDWAIVYAIIVHHLEDFRQFAQEIFEWIQVKNNDL